MIDTLDDVIERAAARREKWDLRFLGMAQYVAQWSKDPSTKTGAVITSPDNVVLSVGYNGFPKGIADTPTRLNDRETKYAIIVHCERNAVLRARADVRGATLYTWPFGSCTVCASMMITAGINRVVFPACPADKLDRWGPDLIRAANLYREAGLIVDEYPAV